VYTFDKATANQVIGCLVGEKLDHIAIAVKPTNTNSGTLLAVRRDGQQYVVWSVTKHVRGVDVYGGHYYDAWAYGGSHGAFIAASKQMEA
jgi:hypothetical protein